MFSDRTLAQRLEMAEATSNAVLVEAKRSVFPQCDAEWFKVGGAWIIYDGPTSPLNQTFGLGLFDPVGNTEVDFIEDFFSARHAAISHEISPLSDIALLRLLCDRGYLPIEFTNVMYQPIGSGFQFEAAPDTRVSVRQAQANEKRLWSETAAKGWSEIGDFADSIREMGEVSVKSPTAPIFLAELEGEPIAAGSLNIINGVAVLSGASTVPNRRRMGGQMALLKARLNYAVSHGCELAMICAPPDSSSQRNAERSGFRIAYTRTKWYLGRNPNDVA
jgi:hypothetical protein